MLALRVVGVRDVEEVLGSAKDALLFLVALLVLAELLERSGFFDWAAVAAARLARGDARALYRNVFLLGAVVTVILSLDTTAVILTPLVLAFVDRLRLPARPYVFACAFVANTASLLLPISNLTNLLFAGSFRFPFGEFAARMLSPQIAALAVTFAMLRWRFRAELPRRFAVDGLPQASSVIAHRGYFRASISALVLVGVGYFTAPALDIQPYVPAFAAALLLAAYGVRTGHLRIGAALRHIGWSVLPFVIGLFVVVRGVENLGVGQWAVHATEGMSSHGGGRLALVVATCAAASNVINNLPAALLARTILQQVHAPPVQVYGALLGTNIGPNVVPFGSLATILVLQRAGARGLRVGAGEFFRTGLVVTTVTLVAATAALAVTFGGP